MVLWYTHPYTNTVRQDRNQAVCALQTEPIVCRWAFNGPTAGHKEHTAPAHCYASHCPTLSHPEERGQPTGTPTPPCVCVCVSVCVCEWVYTFDIRYSIMPLKACFVRRFLPVSSNSPQITKRNPRPVFWSKRIGLRKNAWKSGLKRRKRCWLFIRTTLYCTLTHTHTHTHTHKHPSQPLPLTPSCTSA